MQVDRKRQNLILFALVLLASAPFLFVSHLPLQDIPNWTLEATILNHADSQRFALYYFLEWLPVPNSLATLIIAGLGRSIGEAQAARVLAFFCVMLFAFSVVYLRRTDGRLTPHIEVLGVLFACHHFFMMGYLNFALGLALAFFTIGYHYRRASNIAVESAVVLGLLLVLVYFAHFLAYFVAVLAVVFTALRNWAGPKKFLAPMLAIGPSAALLVWYTVAHAGAFAIGYEYTFLNYIWYKVAPFAPLTNFYPITTPAMAWLVVTINALVIVSLLSLVIWLIAAKRANFGSPLTIVAVVLLVLGLVAPTKLFELIRPGQRLLFAGFFLFLADVRAPRFLRKELRPATIVLIAALTGLMSFNLFVAGKKVDRAVDALWQKVPTRATFLIANDSHFDFGENESFSEKLRNPFSYPVWVNPLKSIPLYHVARHGGMIGYLFPTGLVRARNDRPPAINRLSQLADPVRTEPFSHAVLSGQTPRLNRMTGRLSPQFRTVWADTNIAIMVRRLQKDSDLFAP